MKPKRRIYFAANAVPGVLGGVELWCARAALQLREAGYETGILAAEYDPADSRSAASILRSNYDRYGMGTALAEIPIAGLGLKGRPPAWVSVSKRAAFYGEQILALGPDVIFPNEVALAWDCCAGAAWSKRGPRVACFIHTDNDYTYELLYRHRWLLDEATGVSSVICEKIEATSHVKTRRIPYGVPTLPAEPFERRPADGSLRLGFVGRLFEPHKGIMMLPEVVADLRKRGIESELWIVGEGPDEAMLRARAEETGTAEALRWFGAVGREEVLSILASIEILLMPSFYEGISIALLEAMAQGAVPVVTPVSGMKDAIENRESGIILENRSAAEMADACAWLASDRARLRAMSAAARQRAVAEYGEDVHRGRLTAFIEDLLTRPAPAWPRDLLPSGDPIGRTHRWVPEPFGTAVRRLSALF
jgi:glycosyltransferase involved in cell wall biosynthesis